jgi:hypothetical protein
MTDITTTFLEKKAFPRVLGAIDGCHIPTEKPTIDGNYYYNKKKFFSVALQGICKDNMAFIDDDCHWPRLVHDARVLRTSPIYIFNKTGLQHGRLFVICGNFLIIG